MTRREKTQIKRYSPLILWVNTRAPKGFRMQTKFLPAGPKATSLRPSAKRLTKRRHLPQLLPIFHLKKVIRPFSPRYSTSKTSLIFKRQCYLHRPLQQIWAVHTIMKPVQSHQPLAISKATLCGKLTQPFCRWKMLPNSWTTALRSSKEKNP